MAITRSFTGRTVSHEKVLHALGIFFIVVIGLLLLLFWIHRSSRETVKTIEGTVFINATAPIAETDNHFICATLDWWPPDKCDYGTCSWGRASLLNLDLNNSLLMNAVKAFSPLKIRMGGTLQDRVIYETEEDQQSCVQFVKNSSEFLGFSQGCLPMSRWDELNAFFKKTGAVVTFGLNALNGRTVKPDGSVEGAWNASNAESLMRYTVKKGYSVYGWELGNELGGNGIGARIAADQYALDIAALQKSVQDIYRGTLVNPLVLAPGGFFDAEWFTEFIDKSTKNLQVVTHHIYNLGPGVDGHLVEKILNPFLLDGVSQSFSGLQNILESSGTSALAWVGEAGGAYNSGHNLVSNTFVSSFWYLDQLGMASSYNTKTYCRQTLIGGNYGLLSTTTFVPNPDYYSAILWHRLMGSKVLSTSFSGTKKIRAYSHCSKLSKGISLILINLDSQTTILVFISTENATSQSTLTLQQGNHNSSTKIATGSKNGEYTREEYHLTAQDRNIHSQTMLLNGEVLTVDSFGNIPSLDPIHVNMSDPITIGPFSIVFVHIPSINVTACR